jgi:hypothetical protein
MTVKQQMPIDLEKHGKTTRRGRLLADMKPIVPWSKLLALVDRRFLRSERCRSIFCNCGSTSPAHAVRDALMNSSYLARRFAA